MNNDLTITCPFILTRGAKGKLQLAESHAEASPEPVGRIPKLSRLMALAIRLEYLIATGDVKDMAELARIGHVSRPRITQILNLRSLAPDIQEEILFLPEVQHGRDPIKEWQARPIAATLDWNRQRKMWRKLKSSIEGAQTIP